MTSEKQLKSVLKAINPPQQREQRSPIGTDLYIPNKSGDNKVRNLTTDKLALTTAGITGDVLTRLSDGSATWQTPTAATAATGAEVDTGTDNVKMVTPLAIADSLYAKEAYVDVKANTASPTFTGTVTVPQLKLSGSVIVATAAELNYSSGVTSAIQTQIDLKAPIAAPIFTGTVTVPQLKLSGSVITATPTELNYSSGVTSGIQAQINAISGIQVRATAQKTTTGATYATVVNHTVTAGAVPAGGCILVRVIGNATTTAGKCRLTWTQNSVSNQSEIQHALNEAEYDEFVLMTDPKTNTTVVCFASRIVGVVTGTLYSGIGTASTGHSANSLNAGGTLLLENKNNNAGNNDDTIVQICY